MDTNKSPQPSGSQVNDSSKRRGPLESLSKEDLIAKCKGLLGLAQKAKQAKDEYGEKNKDLLNKLSEYEIQKDADKGSLLAMKEMIDNLTQNKLFLTSKIKNLEDQNQKLIHNISELEVSISKHSQTLIENEALKRQLKRLTDENEDLISDLEKLESKFSQNNKEYCEQQNTSDQRVADYIRKLKELEQKFTEAKDENLKLNEILDQNKTLNIKQEKVLEESAKNEKIEKREGQNFELSTEIKRLKNREVKLLDEIQRLKIKINDVVLKFKKLKECRKVLMENEEDYSESVSKWQSDIKLVSQKLLAYIRALESDKKDLERRLNFNDKLNTDREIIYVKGIEEKTKLLMRICDKAIGESNEKMKEIYELKLTVVNFQNLNSDLIKKMRILESQISLLEECKKERNDKLDTEQEIAFIKVIEGKTQKLMKICDETMGESYENLKEINELKLTVINLQNIKIELVNKIDILESQIFELEQFKQDTNGKEEATKVDFNRIQENNSSLKHSLENQIAKYEELKLGQNQMALVLKSTKDSYDNLRKDFDELSRETQNKKETEKLLKEEICDLIENSEQKNSTFKNSIQENMQNIERLKAENLELLNEMRELNEALKGRGDVISRQQNTITSLETEIRKISNNNATEVESKEHIIHKLNTQKLNESLSSVTSPSVPDNQSDILSLSSITKIEDSKRMQDVNESLEEKYNKLKIFAIKMKHKIQEQKLVITQYETTKEAEKKNISKPEKISLPVDQSKNLNITDTEKNNKLIDEIECLKNRITDHANEIQSLQNMITSINATVKEKDKLLDTEIKLRKSKEQSLNEKSNEIKVLKQEKNAFNLIRKELEKEKDTLKNKCNDKDKEISKLNELLEKLRKDLEKSKAIGKQSSVLNLEIEAYEKSLNENAEKLNAMKIQNQELIESVKFNESTILSLKQEIKLLEENVNSEKAHSTELKQQIDIMQMRFKQVEHEKLELQSKLQDCIVENEVRHSQLEELRLQISDISAKKDKNLSDLSSEKENICSQLTNTEEKLNQTESKLRILELDLENVRKEYANYKIRAQSVLRQNQSKETSRERELEEELTTTQANFETLNIKLTKGTEIIDNQGKKVEELKQENERIQKRSKEIMDLLEESREQYDLLLDENRKQSRDYQESLKAHRLQIETLTNCYKDQISELEQKNSATIEELKKNSNASISRIAPFGASGIHEQPQKSSDEQKVEMLLMEREDAEGSEASYTISKRKISTRSKHDTIPLDELLNSSLDENVEERYADDDSKISAENEVIMLKDRLQSEAIKNKHLTSLLSETEQDLIKYTQLSEILKEELRRQERTLEREKHMHNSEYLKNVILKFLTLNSGDERLCLVPVLNTILRLSPDEANALQNVAKGVDTGRSWNLLPIWSNNNH